MGGAGADRRGRRPHPAFFSTASTRATSRGRTSRSRPSSSPVVTWWTAPHVQALPPVTGPVTLERVRSIVGQRCIACHSQTPTFAGITQPPAGVVLTSSDGIVQNAQRIYQQVVVTRIMPLGNATQITDEERAVIAAWVAAGAPAN